MSKLLASVRNLRATPLGRYIPGNKVLAGALAGVAAAVLAKQNVINVPAVDLAVGAFAVVSYLLPESPVAAAHVVAKAGPVTVSRAVKALQRVTVFSGTPGDAQTAVAAAEAPAVQPSAGVQAPYVGPSQA